MPSTEARVMRVNCSCLKVLPSTRTPVAGLMPSTTMEMMEEMSMAVPAAVNHSQR